MKQALKIPVILCNFEMDFWQGVRADFHFLKRRGGKIYSEVQGRAFFNLYITTGAYTPVGPLFAPVVKQDSQMNWALLIISKTKVNLFEKAASACFLISSHILDIPSYKSQNSQGWC